MKKQKFSGYAQAIVVFIITFVTIGLAYQPLSLYLPAMATELNVSMTVVTGFYTALSIASMIGGLIVGKVVAKIGTKAMVTLGVMCALIAYVIMYFANNAVLIYVAGFVLGFGTIFGCMAMPFVIPAWFVEKRGMILGICMAASGIGGFIGGPLASALIQAKDWHFSCIMFALIMAVLAIPCCIFLKPDPFSVGQKPLGYVPPAAAENGAESSGANESAEKKAKKGKAFLLVLLALFGIQFATIAHSSQITNMMLVNGMTMTFAGIVITIYSVCNTLGNIVMGTINDKKGFKAMWIYQCFWMMAAFAIAIFAKSVPMAVLFAVCVGFGMPTGGTGVTLLCANAFKPEELGSMTGIANSIMSAIGIVSPLLISALFEANGTYNLGFIITIGLVVVSLITGISVSRLKKSEE